MQQLQWCHPNLATHPGRGDGNGGTLQSLPSTRHQPPPHRPCPSSPGDSRTVGGTKGGVQTQLSLRPAVTTPLFQVQGPRNIRGCSSSRRGVSERCCCHCGPGMAPPVPCLSLSSPHGCELSPGSRNRAGWEDVGGSVSGAGISAVATHPSPPSSTMGT